MSDYHATYRVSDDADDATRNSIQDLNDQEDGSDLQEIIDNCTALACEAELFDAAGFRKGWVHADGTYRLT